MDELKKEIKKLKSIVKLLFGIVIITSIGCMFTIFWFYYHPVEKIIVI